MVNPRNCLTGSGASFGPCARLVRSGLGHLETFSRNLTQPPDFKHLDPGGRRFKRHLAARHYLGVVDRSLQLSLPQDIFMGPALATGNADLCPGIRLSGSSRFFRAGTDTTSRVVRPRCLVSRCSLRLWSYLGHVSGSVSIRVPVGTQCFSHSGQAGPGSSPKPGVLSRRRIFQSGFTNGQAVDRRRGSPGPDGGSG